MREETKNNWWRKDLIFWLLLLILVLGIALLIKILITGEPR